jgi:cellulose synthase (UDP-forming)
MLLPKPPNDNEKYFYTNNHSFWFSAFGLFALLCQVLSMTMWTARTPWLYWFFVYIVIYFIYMGFTYFIGMLAKEFDQEKHDSIRNQLVSTGEFPSVDIYLPTAGEDVDLVENTMKYISKLKWNGKLTVYVLDDSGRDSIKEIAQRFNFQYIARPNRGEWKKAGNIRNAFSQSYGKYIVIFDADFCPKEEFLFETVPYFEDDSKIAIMQTPQFFNSYQGQNVIQRGFNYKQELFYRIIQPGRDVFNGAVCCGTNAIYRREALEPFGGTALMSHSEDMHTGFNCVSTGWKIKYLPLVLAKGNAPEDLATYFSQQYRWALGNLILITSKKFWLGKVSPLLKMNYVASILYYVASGWGSILAILPCLAIIFFFPNSVHWYDIALLMPGFLMSHIIQPLWSRARWTLSAVGVSRFVGWSALSAMVDMIRGKQMGWVPSGDKKLANSQSQFQFYKKFFISWNVFCLIMILGGSLYQIFNNNVTRNDDFNWLTMMFFGTVYCLINLKVLSAKDPLKEGVKVIHWNDNIKTLRHSQYAYSAKFLSCLGIFCIVLGLGAITNPNITRNNNEYAFAFKNEDIQGQVLGAFANRNNQRSTERPKLESQPVLTISSKASSSVQTSSISQ